MKVTASLNGVKITKEIPSKWEEVKFHHLLKLNQGDDILKIVSVFTDISIEVLRTAEIKNLDKIVALLSFMKKDIEQDIPITCMGYPIVKNLETESIAQYADLQTLMGTMIEGDRINNISKFPLIVATYAVKPYNWEEAENLANTFLEAPCSEVMAIGNFTLAKLMASSNGIARTSHPVVIQPTKLKRVIRHSLTNLAFTVRYYLWKRTLHSRVRNFLNGQ